MDNKIHNIICCSLFPSHICISKRLIYTYNPFNISLIKAKIIYGAVFFESIYEQKFEKHKDFKCEIKRRCCRCI